MEIPNNYLHLSGTERQQRLEALHAEKGEVLRRIQNDSRRIKDIDAELHGLAEAEIASIIAPQMKPDEAAKAKESAARQLRLVSQQAFDMGDWQSHQEAEHALREYEPMAESQPSE